MYPLYFQVLLLEAGGDPPLRSEVPGFTYPASEDPQYNWNYKTELQTMACRGASGGRCFWPAGKMLGGTSSINGQSYLRGSK